MSIWHVLGLYHKKIGGLRANIWSQGIQLKSKSHKQRTSLSIMFQLPPQIVLGCSNNKWYLNLVFHPLNTSCKNQEPTRHEHNVTAFYTKLYWFHHGRSLPSLFFSFTPCLDPIVHRSKFWPIYMYNARRRDWFVGSCGRRRYVAGRIISWHFSEWVLNNAKKETFVLMFAL